MGPLIVDTCDRAAEPTWWFAEWPCAAATAGTRMLRGEGYPNAEIAERVLGAGGHFRIRERGQLVIVRPKDGAR